MSGEAICFITCLLLCPVVFIGITIIFLSLRRRKRIKFENFSFFAKMPTIYIELHRFNFCHGTYQSSSRNFIGRDQIRTRLRGILTHNDSNSGTYLITGYRGVGKTSLVNKVLDELAPKRTIPQGVIRFFYLVIAVFLSSMFVNLLFVEPYGMKLFSENYTVLRVFLIFICSFIFTFSMSYIAHFSLYRKVDDYVGRYFLCIFLEFLSWGKDHTWSNKLYNIVKATGVISLIWAIYFFFGDRFICVTPIIQCVCFGGLLLIVAIVKGINKMLYLSDKMNNRDYKRKLKYSRGLSYFISCIVLVLFLFTFLALVCVLDSLLFKQLPSYFYNCVFVILVVIFPVLGLCVTLRGDSLEICCLVWRIIKENMNRHYFIKHLFNTPKQLFVKINLGYEELKSIDVLRLISHNVTIEYRKYLYSGVFYWLRTSFVVIICLGITILFSNYFEYDFKLGLKYKYLTDFGFFTFVSKLYSSLDYGISSVFDFIRLTFSLNDYIELYSPNKYINDFLPLKKILFFILLIFIYRSSVYLPMFKFIRGPYLNLKRLEDLQDSIAATIRREEGMATESRTDSFFKIGYHKKVEKNYPMSDAHDIEKRLIDIISNVVNGWFFQRPHFIIVFDELDKLESADNSKERMVKTDSFSPDTIRSRQEAVFKLLSGLKYVLTTMQAKFIFVAGREIYEASLADAADRSNYMSSIFNDVINVPSLMSDFSDDKCSDICSMTERYVCQHLFPKGYLWSEPSLKEYDKYLCDMDKSRHPDKKENKEEVERILALERKKILLMLHNFIVYLTYASKGAPKKMINLFEKNVERLQPYAYNLLIRKSETGSVSPIVRKYYRNTIYYMKFDFYEQYSIGMMSRMVSPIMYRFERGNIHQHGDKLLVSTLFFLDHLYKFHRHSFSWRALESSPELIDVNKTPELRDHITNLLHFLSQNDLKGIGNGLYDFRFFKKMSQEVGFLTRVSEQASAIFNFTLDESLAVKQYYSRRLAKMREQYTADQIKTENAIDELAGMHFTLGELSLYDEDIEEATTEFDSALSILYTVEPSDMTSEQILILVKIMLSLGIAYERQNLNDRAFLIYSETVRILVASRNMDIRELGLRTEEGPEKRMIVKPSIWSHSDKEPELYFEKAETGMGFMEVLDKMSHLHPKIHAIITKITVYESLFLLYLPLLAKFQMIEKTQLGGVQVNDIRRLLKEFYFLGNMMNKENRNMICANFYLKVGDILYYKNSHLFKNKKDYERQFPFDVVKECNATDGSCVFSGYLCGNDNVPDALYFYKHALYLMLYGLNYRDCCCPNRLLNKLIELHDDHKYRGWDETRFNYLAKTLSSIGDMLLSTLKVDNSNKFELMKFLSRYKLNSEQYKVLEALKKSLRENFDINQLSYIAFYYILSALFYKKATAYSMVSFQYMKLLTLIKYNYPVFNEPVIKNEQVLKTSILDVARFFVNKSIRNCGDSFKDIYFENLSDIKKLFFYEKSVRLNSESVIYDEVFESVLIYEAICFLDIDKKDTKKIEEYYSVFDTMKFEITSNIYNRIKFLKFKSEVNCSWLSSLLKLSSDKERSFYASEIDELEKKLNKAIRDQDSRCVKFGEDEQTKKNIAKLVADSIFNLMEVVKFTKIYGETYLLTNIFVADTYHKVMRWIQIKKHLIYLIHLDNINNVLEIDDFKNVLEDYLKHLIGERYEFEMLELSYWTNASRFYFKAEEMHTEGRTYINMINRTCFLNDEYSDQRFHFITARERRKINEDEFKDLRNIKNEMGDEIYDISKICDITAIKDQESVGNCDNKSNDGKQGKSEPSKTAQTDDVSLDDPMEDPMEEHLFKGLVKDYLVESEFKCDNNKLMCPKYCSEEKTKAQNSAK